MDKRTYPCELDTKEWKKPVMVSEWLAMKTGLEKVIGLVEDRLMPAKDRIHREEAPGSRSWRVPSGGAWGSPEQALRSRLTVMRNAFQMVSLKRANRLGQDL